MERTIENGVTIINTCDAVGGIKNTTSGHHGVFYDRNKNNFRASICIGKHRYHLGDFQKLEDAIAIRKEAEVHRADHTFEEWFPTLIGRTKRQRIDK